MEALDDIMKKRKSWAVMLDLLKPYIAPQNAAKRTDDTTCRGAMERYPTPKATADLGHAVGAEIAWCGY